MTVLNTVMQGVDKSNLYMKNTIPPIQHQVKKNKKDIAVIGLTIPKHAEKIVAIDNELNRDIIDMS